MDRLLALVLCAVMLTGCDLTGSHHHRTDTAPSGVATAGSDTVGARVTHIAVGSGTVTFTVKVPGGPAGCAGRPQAQVQGYDAKQVSLVTVVPSTLESSCRGYVTRSFTTDLDLQGRELRVNGELYSVGAGGVVASCDGSLGCNPPANRCDPEWTSRVIPHYDLPPTKRTKVVSCRGRWLVLDVTATANSGAQQHVRWFAELDPHRSWLVVATSRTGGCVDVRLAVSTFPLARCRDLRPPGS